MRIRNDEHFNDIKLNEKYHNVISKQLKEYENDQENIFLLRIKILLHYILVTTQCRLTSYRGKLISYTYKNAMKK